MLSFDKKCFRAASPMLIETRQLGHYQSVGTPFEEKIELVPFDCETYTVYSIEATLKLSHGGVVLKDFTTFNDFYGYLTSLDNLKDEIESIKQRFSIDEKSTIEITAHVDVIREVYFKNEMEEYLPVSRNKKGRVFYSFEAARAYFSEDNHEKRTQEMRNEVFIDGDPLQSMMVWSSVKDGDWDVDEIKA